MTVLVGTPEVAGRSPKLLPDYSVISTVVSYLRLYLVLLLIQLEYIGSKTVGLIRRSTQLCSLSVYMVTDYRFIPSLSLVLVLGSNLPHTCRMKI